MKIYKKNKFFLGFTLLEFIVVITIASIIMTSLIIQQGKWNKDLAVSTQAYELAMMIRQAQIYSLGVREDVGSTGDKFNVSYGVHVAWGTGFSEKYILFADRNRNGRYDLGEEIDTKLYTRGVKTIRVCAAVLNPCPGNGPRQLSITFSRPTPSANMVFMDIGGSPISPQPQPPAYIKVGPVDESSEVVIKIEANGQVSI